MTALKCTMCGGGLIADVSGEFSLCENCGTKFTKETIKKMLVELSGPISVEGIHNADKLAENAETFLSIGETRQAFVTFGQLSREYPSDYRGWWGIAQMLPLEQLAYDAQHNNKEIKMPGDFVKALKFAPEDKKEEIRKFYKDRLEEAEKYALAAIKAEKEYASKQSEISNLNTEISKLKDKIKFPAKLLLACAVSILFMLFLFEKNSTTEVIQVFSIPTIIITGIFIIRVMLYFSRNTKKNELMIQLTQANAEWKELGIKRNNEFKNINLNGDLDLSNRVFN